MTPGSIVVVGSLNADLVSRVERLPRPGETVSATAFDFHCGGKGANQAYAAARLGGSVAMIGCVGSDVYGRQLRSNLQRTGVDVSAVEIVDGSPSGIALVTVEESGENQIIIVPGANARVTPERLLQHRTMLESAAVVLLQLEIPIEVVTAAARLARASGATVILDPAPARQVPGDLLAAVTYLTPNETELAALTADGADEAGLSAAAETLLSRGVGNVIVKLGDEGARLFSGKGEHHWPAYPATVVDTTAAGDAFNGALAVALASGVGIEAAGHFACAAAAIAVSRHGAQPSMPGLAEVLALVPEDLRGVDRREAGVQDPGPTTRQRDV